MRRAALDGPEGLPPGPVIDVTMVLGRKTAAGQPARGRSLESNSPISGWGGRIRTSEWEIQSLLAYHLPTPQRSARSEPPNGRSKVSCLTIAATPTGLQRRPDQGWLLLRALPLVLVEDSILDELPRLVVDGMSDILIRPVRPFPARHGHEHPVRPFDDLEASNDERVVEGHARERFQFVVFPERNPHFSDLECHASLHLEFRRPIPRRP